MILKGKNIKEKILNQTKLTNGCLVYTGFISSYGYGRLYDVKSNRNVLAHRALYEFIRGKIPKDLYIDHLCRNRACVNIDHMELVTLRENTLRGKGIAMLNKMKKKCIRGHEFTKENTHIYNNFRVCITCRKETFKIWKEKHPKYWKRYEKERIYPSI